MGDFDNHFIVRRKIAESQAEQRLKTLLNILSADRKFESETDVHQTIESSMQGLLDWDSLHLFHIIPPNINSRRQKLLTKLRLNTLVKIWKLISAEH